MWSRARRRSRGFTSASALGASNALAAARAKASTAAARRRVSSPTFRFVFFFSPPRDDATARRSRSRASDERGRFARRAATSDRASPNAFETEPEPSAGSSRPRLSSRSCVLTRRGSVAPGFFAEPLAHVPARVPNPEPHVGGVHGGGRAGRWTRRRVRASRKTSRRLLRSRFPRPGRVSPRGARRGSHLGRRVGGADHPAGREPGRHPLARPENVTRRSGTVPEVHARPAPNVPSVGGAPGAPRPGVAKPASCEAAVLKKRACFDFRGKLQVSVSFPKKRSGAPHARSERASRASGPAVDTRLRRRDERMSSREICKYFLHGACRNGASCRFSHEMSAPKSTVCTYYLAGNCAYGDKCRYDHVRPKVRAPIERRARSDTARGVPRPRPPHPRRFPDRARDRSPATTSPTFSSACRHTRGFRICLFSRSGSAASLFFALSLTRNLHPPKRRTPAPRAVPPAAPRGRVSAGASGAPSMNTGAREFVPGGANALGAQMGRLHVGGGGGFRSQPPPCPPVRGGARRRRGGAAAARRTPRNLRPRRRSGGTSTSRATGCPSPTASTGGTTRRLSS